MSFHPWSSLYPSDLYHLHHIYLWAIGTTSKLFTEQWAMKHTHVNDRCLNLSGVFGLNPSFFHLKSIPLSTISGKTIILKLKNKTPCYKNKIWVCYPNQPVKNKNSLYNLIPKDAVQYWQILKPLQTQYKWYIHVLNQLWMENI